MNYVKDIDHAAILGTKEEIDILVAMAASFILNMDSEQLKAKRPIIQTTAKEIQRIDAAISKDITKGF